MGKKLYDRKVIAADVCKRLAMGEPLAAICREKGMPDPVTIWLWEKDDPDLAKAIARAREDGADAIALECLDIANLPPAFKTDAAGNSSIDQGDVAHRKLQIETRLKLLAKWHPRKYGDKLELAGGVSLTLEDLISRSRERDVGS